MDTGISMRGQFYFPIKQNPIFKPEKCALNAGTNLVNKPVYLMTLPKC